MAYVTTGGIRLYYESHGEGPPVVFVHGGNGNTLSWFNQMPLFTRKYRCILVDMRGYKNSFCEFEQYHTKEFVPDMLAVLADAGVERAAFVCQSVGAWAGLPMAVKHPERVSCLVINSSPTPAYSERNWAVLQRSGAVAAAAQHGAASKSRDMGLGPRFVETQPELTFLFESIARLNWPRRTHTMWDPEVALHPEHFAGYAVPTLVMGGALDTFLTPDHHLHIATLIPGAITHTFENCGHYAYIEDPAQYNRVVSGFLEAQGWG